MQDFYHQQKNRVAPLAQPKAQATTWWKQTNQSKLCHMMWCSGSYSAGPQASATTWLKADRKEMRPVRRIQGPIVAMPAVRQGANMQKGLAIRETNQGPRRSSSRRTLLKRPLTAHSPTVMCRHTLNPLRGLFHDRSGLKRRYQGEPGLNRTTSLHVKPRFTAP